MASTAAPSRPGPPLEDKRTPRSALPLSPLFSPSHRNPSHRSHGRGLSRASPPHRCRPEPPRDQLKPPFARPHRPHFSGGRDRAREPGIAAIGLTFFASDRRPPSSIAAAPALPLLRRAHTRAQGEHTVLLDLFPRSPPSASP